MAIKTLKIVADFETTTDPEDLRVWAVCAVDIDTLETVYLGNSLEGFMAWLKDKNTTVYFHNARFDTEFIFPYLMKELGFKYSKSRESGTFDTLITDTGVFYSATIYFEKQNKKYKKAVIYDSLKKLPMSVSRIADSFRLEDHKLKIDYDEYRAPGHELTEAEKRYIVNDCRIVANALQIQFAEGLKKMTNASDAMHEFKQIITKQQFEGMFPVFPIELDSDIRRAYKGGFVYLKPEHRHRRGHQGITLDVNSLYPSVMYDRLLPYGYPMYFEGEPEDNERFPLFIVRINCDFEIKPEHIPTIQLKNNRAFIETEYLTSSNGEIVSMTLTNVDLELFLDHYNINYIEYVKGWRFKARKGIFKEYIDKWMHIKETTKGGRRALAKLMLNSLYGKFATNPKGEKRYTYYDPEDDTVKFAVPDKDRKVPWYNPDRNRVELVEVDLEERSPVYTAMGAFITAYAREKTIRSAQAVFDRFIYADTDSLHLIGHDEPEGLEIHPTKLGAWKNEGRFEDSMYIRAKTYMETMLEHEKEDTLRNYAKILTNVHTRWVRREPDGIHYAMDKVTCAGMPDNVKKSVTYDNFHTGSVFEGKLVPKRYPGGVVLENRTFTIK